MADLDIMEKTTKYANRSDVTRPVNIEILSTLFNRASKMILANGGYETRKRMTY